MKKKKIIKYTANTLLILYYVIVRKMTKDENSFHTTKILRRVKDKMSLELII